ncbi:MAG: DUF4245 domain-containing protein [Dermatophilaceae bacterium]
MSAPLPTPPVPAAPVRSRYAMGTVANMARSLVVILGIVAVLVVIVPRSDGVTQPPVDAAGAAAFAAGESGLALEVPVGLGSGWKATSARYAAATDSVPTWQAGWTTPSGEFVGIRQAKAVTARWLEVATNSAGAEGTTVAAGRTWQRLRDARGQVHVVAVNPDGLTTVVSASSERAELSEFLEALRPAGSSG